MADKREIIIRPAELSDAQAIVAILQEHGLFPAVDEESRRKIEKQVSLHLGFCSAGKSHSVLVGENNEGEVIAYSAVHWLPCMMLSGPEGYISELFVRWTGRGRGVGQKLLEVIKEKARERGCSRLILMNEGNQTSTYSRGFFLKLGWKEIPPVPAFVLPLNKPV